MFAVILLVASSCNKFLDIEAPADKVESRKIFESESTALSAVTGLYAQIRLSSTGIFNGGLSFFPGVGSDELYSPTNQANLQEFYNNNLVSGNSTSSTMWTYSYQYIFTTNSILEALERSHSLSKGAKDVYTGEMIYIRSLVYFYLVNLFGDVPLVLSADYTINASLARSPVEKVYIQISDDLLKAQELLDKSYGTLPNTRISKMAVTALLARVFLYRQEWENAAAQASVVINSGRYKLEPDLNKVFQSTSSEILFQISKVNANTSEGAAFIPSSASVLPSYAATDYFMTTLQANDLRKAAWLTANIISGKPYYYPSKYKVRNNTTVGEYNVVQRLAEMYLIRAEANARLGNLAAAEFDLNAIRRRAGLEDAKAITQRQLLDSIAKERQIEFFAEWGHRWFDLKRTGEINAVLGERKTPNWQSSDALYPIPASELRTNPLLTQNPGYE